jgi:hypothetical protein
MFEEGNIIYFTPFYFPNGKSAPKPKYCIVLKSLNGTTIIASLPTRTDSIPSSIPVATGCVEMPAINLNSFIFDTSTEVTECGKYFDFNTFVYGHQIDFYSIDLFKEIYQIEGTDYEIFGKLKQEHYEKLLDCLRNSKSVKKKFIPHL